MSSNNTLRKAKRASFEKKQEQKGKRVINWIFGILAGLAIACLVYSAVLAS